MANRWASRLLGVVLSIGFCTPTFAAGGLVVLEDTPGCDYFVVATANGYALLEWYGGVISIWQGDEVYGDFENYGMTTVHIRGRGDMRVWVDDYWVSDEQAAEYFYSNC
jgi:hypothetical protein